MSGPIAGTTSAAALPPCSSLVDPLHIVGDRDHLLTLGSSAELALPSASIRGQHVGVAQRLGRSLEA